MSDVKTGTLEATLPGNQPCKVITRTGWPILVYFDLVR